MSTTPNALICGQVPRSPVAAIVTTANNAMSGNVSTLTNAVKICDAGANGSLVRRLTARPIATANSVTFPANQAQLLKSTGSAFVIDDDATVPAQTVSTSSGTTAGDFGYTDAKTRYLPAGYSLYVAIGTTYANGVAFTIDLVDL